MSGETDLAVLLRSAQPRLAPGDFVFACVPDLATGVALSPVGLFQEAEGVTAICPADRAARAGFTALPPFRQITFTIPSSLEAVGFLAAIAARLAEAGIPCNAISAFHHDHLFVPARDADRALAALAGLTSDRPRPR